MRAPKPPNTSPPLSPYRHLHSWQYNDFLSGRARMGKHFASKVEK